MFEFNENKSTVENYDSAVSDVQEQNNKLPSAVFNILELCHKEENGDQFY